MSAKQLSNGLSVIMVILLIVSTARLVTGQSMYPWLHVFWFVYVAKVGVDWGMEHR